MLFSSVFREGLEYIFPKLIKVEDMNQLGLIKV